VDSGCAQKGRLWASAHGRMRVDLNGKTVLQKETENGHRFAERQVEIQLETGANRLSVYVERGESGFGFTALLCNHLGDGLFDITYRAE